MNSALIIIDYQPTHLNSMSRHELINNTVTVAKLAKGYDIPTIVSTVNVTNHRNGDKIKVLKDVLGEIKAYDRTSINAREDKDFVEAVKATGRNN